MTILKGMQNLVVFLAFHHIRRRPLQSLLTVCGVAVGVMVLLVALSLTNGFISELISSTLRATPHVDVSDYFGESWPYDAELAADLGEHPNVAAVSPYLSNQSLIARRADADLGISGRSGYTQILGIDPVLAQGIFSLDVLTREQEALEQGQSIILGASLARSLAAFPGDEVRLRDITGRTQSFTVVGTFNVGNELIDSAVSFVALKQLQDFMRKEGEVTGYHIGLHNPERALETATGIALEHGVLARAWQQLYSLLIEQLRLQKTLIAVVVFLIVLVAAMGIANVLVLTVSEKNEEIAILRALGASRRQILALFTLEGFLLGCLGTLLGALLALAICLYFQVKPYSLPGSLYLISELPVEVQARDFIWVCAFAMVTSVVAGLLPAQRASGFDPAKILR